MKNGALFLLIILILGLILAPFLGGSVKEGYTDTAMSYADKVQLASGVTTGDSSTGAASGSSSSSGSSGYDNYDHYSKSSTPTVFYGPNGSKATVMKDSSNFYIIITGSNGETVSYSTKVPDSSSSSSSSSSNSSSTSGKNTTSSDSISSLMKQFNNATFYGPNGGSARFFTGSDGQYAIESTKANGDTTIYTANNTYTYNYGGQSSSYSASPYDSSTTSSSGSGSDSGSGSNSANSSGQYDSSMPQGISKSMIPRGQEDLYILKSEIVPPVCPACPTSSACPTSKKEKCPPCPACARCPEPSFECKKVPNYSAAGNNSYYGSYDATGSFNSSSGGASYLPVPVLSDFSTFGM
jgi:hypothetical protein